ncbi:preprotein translocase subunit YajC [Elusimicrobiota bacterium]
MEKISSKLVLFLVFLFSTSSLYAEAPAQGNPMGSFLPLIVIFVIFYFFLIRPQQKKAKDHQQMLNTLKKDDKVITSGGIHGVVAGVKGDIIELKIAENVKIQVSKSAIGTIVLPENKPVNPEVVKQ